MYSNSLFLTLILNHTILRNFVMIIIERYMDTSYLINAETFFEEDFYANLPLVGFYFMQGRKNT